MQIKSSYEPTRVQAELHGDAARFKVIVFGRRSGKSTYAFNEALITCLEKPNQKVWIITPTFQQARDIYWKGSDIARYLLDGMYEKKNDSTLTVEFFNGSILQLKSAERPETLRGSGLDLIIIDEAAEIRYLKRLWEEVLLPALSDKLGRGIIIGTPKGYNYFYTMYMFGIEGVTDWKSWKVPTRDSDAPWTRSDAGQNEIVRLQEVMSEDAFAQEYGADFRKHTGLVFKDFDRLVHVKPFEIKTNLAIECGHDFGYTNPTAVAFSYFDNDDVWYIFDEYYQEEKTIFNHTGTIKSIREKYPNPIKAVYGDSEDAQSISEYGGYGWFITPVVKSRQSVIIGIDRISERLKVDAQNREPRIYIHPRCVNVIKEFERYRWAENRNPEMSSEEPEKENDHLMDALRYIILMHNKNQKQIIKKAPIRMYNPAGARIKKRKTDLWDTRNFY